MNEGRHYRHYVLAILTVTSVLSIADRLILSILLQDIKQAFTLSDTQLGLISGLAFTSFYVVFGFPIAWLADRRNRKNIIAVSLTAWSLMTALCGVATGFWTLFAARMGVGVGEAGGGPAAMSILPDYFRKHELARAMGVHALGSTLGTAAGLMIGGYVAHRLGWRMAFVTLGLPGVLLAVLLYFTVAEPKRGRFHLAALNERTDAEDWRTVISSLMANTIYVRVTAAYALQIVIGYAFASWLAAIMLRNFPVSTADVGFYLGLAFVLGGIPGPLLGGILTDLLVKRDARWRAWLPGLAILACLPAFWLCLAANSFWAFLGLFSCGYMIFLLAQPPTLSLLQLSVKPGERALAVATAMLFNNLVGQALGAFLIGSSSEWLTPVYGAHALGQAVILVSTLFGIPAALVYFWTAAAITPGVRARKPAPSK